MSVIAIELKFQKMMVPKRACKKQKRGAYNMLPLQLHYFSKYTRAAYNAILISHCFIPELKPEKVHKRTLTKHDI